MCSFIRPHMGFMIVHIFLLLTNVFYFFLLVLDRFSPRPDLAHSYPTHFPTFISIAPTLVPYLLSVTNITTIATLALGSQPRQGFTRMWAKIIARECGRGWEWTLTLPNELPFWELESQRTPETSYNNCKGQNPSPWRIFYIVGKLLKCKCPKWTRMTHLDISNTSYGQKKGQKSNWQFDSRPREVRNRPDSLVYKWRPTHHRKALDEGYNFGLDLVQIRGPHQKL
jgi:hypothetical protein